jgi:hypothetical protein
VAYSPDGLTLATASWDRSVRLWDARTGQHKATLSGHSYEVRSVAFSPDGLTLASASSDKRVHLWDPKTGQVRATLGGHVDIDNSVAYSPDGLTLATGSEGQAVHLWDARTGQVRATLSGHTDRIFCVAFSPDGRLVATGSGDGTTRLWSVPEGTLLTTLHGQGKPINSVAFGPGGRLLATGSGDGTIWLWVRLVDGENADMALTRPALPPRPRVTLTRSGDGIVYPGDLAWVHLCVENAGKGELVRMWVHMQSDQPWARGLLTVLGQVNPGEKVERCLATLLPVDTPPGPLEMDLIFHEANGHAPQFLPVRFNLQPLPRPDLPLRWEFINDGTGNSFGAGDARPRRGESIDVAVRIENQTGEDLDGLYLTLQAIQAPAGVAVNVPRCDLDPLPDGESIEGRVTFSVKPQGAPGPAKFELRLQSLDGRTFAVVPVETTIA